MDIVVASENTVVVLFEQSISHEIFSDIRFLVNKIDLELNEYIADMVPSYASIHITFNVLKISGLDFKNKLAALANSISSQEASVEHISVVEIPVYYGAEVALDLGLVASNASMTESEVIKIHSEKVYDVYAIGFSPGFAYLGNVDERICLPRKETPRKKVAQGSLGIADQQTAVYPSESPGGWQIIGRTPSQLIDYNSEKLTHFSAGDKVKFNPISQKEYLRLGGTF